MDYYLSTFRKYAEFNGRARRKEYWYFVFINFLISMALTYVETIIDSQLLSIVFSIAIIVPSIAVGIRRMHDVDKSGWYILIPIYDLVLAATEGTKGDNQYGADPKAAN